MVLISFFYHFYGDWTKYHSQPYWKFFPQALMNILQQTTGEFGQAFHKAQDSDHTDFYTKGIWPTENPKSVY